MTRQRCKKKQKKLKLEFTETKPIATS